MDSEKIFEALASSKEFEEFTSVISKLAGLVMSINSPSGATFHTFKTKQESNRICCMIKKSEAGRTRCDRCDSTHFKKAGELGQPLVYACHAGFLDIAVPIFVESTHVATLASGQMLAEPPSEEAFAALAQRLAKFSFDQEKLREAYWAAPYVPKDKAKHIMTLLKLFADHLCSSIFRIRELEEKLSREDVRAARKFMETEFKNPAISLSDAAAAAGLSPTYFSHVFSQETKMPFAKFLQKMRVEEAKRLLRDTTENITTVCFSCGFNSLTHFNRVFRAFEGKSPRGWRASLPKD